MHMCEPETIWNAVSPPIYSIDFMLGSKSNNMWIDLHCVNQLPRFLPSTGDLLGKLRTCVSNYIKNKTMDKSHLKIYIHEVFSQNTNVFIKKTRLGYCLKSSQVAAILVQGGIGCLVTHICVSEFGRTCSWFLYALSLVRGQTITWTNIDLLAISNKI